MLDLRPLGPPAATTAPPHSNRPSRRVVESDDSADDIDDSPHAAVEVERSPRSYGQRQQQDQDPPPVSCGTDGEEGSLKIAGPARGPAVIPVLVRQRRAEALPNRASMQADDLVDDDELPDFDFVQELGTGILQAPEQPQQQPTRVNHITARAKNTFVRQVASATGVAAEAAASDISDEGVSIGGNGRGMLTLVAAAAAAVTAGGASVCRAGRVLWARGLRKHLLHLQRWRAAGSRVAGIQQGAAAVGWLPLSSPLSGWRA